VVNGTNPTSSVRLRVIDFRAAKIGYVFQSFNLLQGFTALETYYLDQLFGGVVAARPRSPVIEKRRS